MRERRKRHPYFLISLLSSIVCMLLFYVLFLPSWEVNDDAAINRLVDGSMGSYTTHLVYQNVVLGYLYTFLYKLYAGLPWYALFQYTVIALSLAAVLYVLLKRFKVPAAAGLFGMVLLYGGFSCLIRMQFTKTAGMAALAGSILLLQLYDSYEEHRKKERYGMIVLSLLLIGVGFALRMQEAAVCIVLTGPAWLYVWLLKEQQDGESKKHVRRGLMLILLAALVCGVLYGADKTAYQGDTWQAYRSFNRVRGKLFDHGFPDYDANAEALESLGLDRDAYALLRSWTFADPEMFSTDTLQGISSLNTKPDYINKENLKNFLKTVPYKIWGETIVYLFASALIIWFLLGKHSKKDVAMVLLMLAGFGVLYYYFYVNGRYLYNRVDVPLFTAMTMTLLFLTEPAEGRGKRLRITLSCLCAAGLMLFSIGWRHPITYYARNGSWAAKTVSNREIRQKKLERIAADENHVYLTKIKVLHTSDSYGPFDTAPANGLTNVLLLGGWVTWSPAYNLICSLHHIENPLLELAVREDMLVADDNIELTVRYLESRLHTELTYERIPKSETGLGKLKIYKICAEDNGDT